MNRGSAAKARGCKALSEQRAKNITQVMKLLSHPARLRLVARLLDGECSVSELERELKMRQPSLSQHLGELREGSLVATRREHKVVFYRLKDARIAVLTGSLIAAFDEVRHGHAPAPVLTHPRHVGAAIFAQVGDGA